MQMIPYKPSKKKKNANKSHGRLLLTQQKK